jgi:DNA polymerase III epsilon subunit family exonuclease
MTNRTLVVLDIETTGLESKTDKIIEIGAVRFSDKGIEVEFETLINPGIRIPPFISQLTGISDAMVKGNEIPYLEEAIGQLIEFVGDLPVIGHNVKFDLSFLRAAGALKKNLSIDTYEMASVILPAEGRYNLRALGQVLGVPMRATHRAMDDTKVTQAIYEIMFNMIRDLPLPTLGEIVRLSPGPGWGGTLPFKWAFDEMKKNNPSGAAEPYQNPMLSQAPPLELIPIEPKETISGLYLDEVSSEL